MFSLVIIFGELDIHQSFTLDSVWIENFGSRQNAEELCPFFKDSFQTPAEERKKILLMLSGGRQIYIP